MCKPNKIGNGTENKLGHRGFGKLKKEANAAADLKDAPHELAKIEFDRLAKELGWV